MPKSIKITAGKIQIFAELNDSPTAKAIADALPIKAKTQRWGDEIYFPIPVAAELDEDSTELVQAGELGYWPTGNALCLFFGPTPISGKNEIRAASAVNIVGRMKADWSRLKNVTSGADVLVESS